MNYSRILCHLHHRVRCQSREKPDKKNMWQRSEGADGQSNNCLIVWLIACCLIDRRKISSSSQMYVAEVRKIQSELKSRGGCDKQSPCLDSCHVESLASIWLLHQSWLKRRVPFDIFITFSFTLLSAFISPEGNTFAIDWLEGNKSWRLMWHPLSSAMVIKHP